MLPKKTCVWGGTLCNTMAPKGRYGGMLVGVDL
jgi:hypothetical protein